MGSTLGAMTPDPPSRAGPEADPDEPVSQRCGGPGCGGPDREPAQPPTFGDEHPADAEHYDSDHYEPL